MGSAPADRGIRARSRRPWRTILGFILIAGALTAAGCAWRDDRPLVVVQRVIDTPPGTPPPGVSYVCPLQDDIRPTLGCLAPVLLGIEFHVMPESTTVRRTYNLPAWLSGRLVVLECRFKASTDQTWTTLPPYVTRTTQGTIGALFSLPPEAAGKEVDLQVFVRALPSRLPRTKSRALRLGPGAVLVGGIGIDPLSASVRAAPVQMRVTAHTGGHSKVLLDRTLDFASSETNTWSDYRLDLSPLSGRTVRFAFTARARAASDKARAPGLALPLWTTASVLEPRDEPEPRLPRNVLILSLDTLRADHVGAYGCDLPTTPNLDRFAATATVFERTVSAYPSTTASHMTMLTGVYPSVHGVWHVLRALPPEIPTLTQLLATGGYQTAAITEDGMLAAGSGFARGFASYREYKEPDRTDTPGFIEEVVSTALRWLGDHRRERFFLFLHSYVVHAPYTPPPSFDVFTTYRQDGKEVAITADTPVPIRSRYKYAGEVRYADSEVRRLLDGIERLGLADRTIVVVTADHGEAFDSNHGCFGHGCSLAEEVLHVPLIIRAPGLVPAGVRVPTAVSLVDLAPTLLDLLGVPAPATIQGQSLVPLLRRPDDEEFAQRDLFSELMLGDQYQLAVHHGPFKWIIGQTLVSKDQAYDLATDPEELHDRIGAAKVRAGPVVIARYHEQCKEVLERLGHPATVAVTPDQRTIDKLRALGYVQ